VERSITAEQLVEESKDEFAGTGGPPKMLRMDNGPEFVCQVLQQFYDSKMLRPDIPPGAPWNNGHIESLNNALRKDCLDRNHWNTLFEAPWSSAASRTRTMTDTATQRWATVRPPSTPRRAGAPTPSGLRDQLNLDQTNPTLIPGGLGMGTRGGQLRLTRPQRRPHRTQSRHFVLRSVSGCPTASRSSTYME
jgi:hypothetical protein